MTIKRKKHPARFKAKVAVEAIKGIRTVSELAAAHSVHPTQIHHWKKQAMEGLPGVFQTDKPKTEQKDISANLFEEIGRLKVELDWLKKKSGDIR